MKTFEQLAQHFGHQPLVRLPLNKEEVEFIQSDARAELEKQNEKLVQALIDVIQSAVHPDVALRVISIDLKPIRAVLKPIIGANEELGIK